MLVLQAAELAARLDEVVSARSAVVAIGAGRLHGDAAASLMFSDWAILDSAGELVIDTPSALAGVVWRIGAGAIALVSGVRRMPAAEALQCGLCDEIGDGADFLGGRSEIALDAGAALVARRGGDALERAMFAWLFATGAPREGLTAFLEKGRPRWGHRSGFSIAGMERL